jgi:hypothetical protein
MRSKRDENFLKKKFQKVLVIKKKILPLHPQKQRKKFSEKKRRHVHRHIELTAVLDSDI